MGYGDNRKQKVSPHHPTSSHADDPINSQYTRAVLDYDLRPAVKRVNPESSPADIIASIAADKVKAKFGQRAEDLNKLNKRVADILCKRGSPEYDAADLEHAMREISHFVDQLAEDTKSFAERFDFAAKRLTAQRTAAAEAIVKQTAAAEAHFKSLKAESTALEHMNLKKAEAIRMQMHKARMDELRRSKD